MSFGGVYNVRPEQCQPKKNENGLKIILLKKKILTEKLMAPKILNWFWLIMSYSSLVSLRELGFSTPSPI